MRERKLQLVDTDLSSSGGEMRYKAEYKFWGCSDYRSDDPESCRHKEYGRIGARPPRVNKQCKSVLEHNAALQPVELEGLN